MLSIVIQKVKNLTHLTVLPIYNLKLCENSIFFF